MIERGLRWLALLAVTVACSVFTWVVLGVKDSIEDPYWLVQNWVDAAVDAGGAAAAIDPADPLLGQRTIVVTSSINERAAAHVIPRLEYLARLDPHAPIDLIVTTTGGWRDSAFAIIDTMRTITAPVNTWAIGGCYSAGTLVVAGGTGKRIATSGALLMVHANLDDADEPFGQESRELAREERFWREHAKLPPDWVLDSDTSYYLTPEEARRYGVVDEVRERPGR